MSFPRKREAAPVEETAADFYDTTRGILREAAAYRDQMKLRRAAIRLDSERFAALSDSRRDELSELYSDAALACGMGSLA